MWPSAESASRIQSTCQTKGGSSIWATALAGVKKQSAPSAHNPDLAADCSPFPMLTRNDILFIRALRDRNTRISERKFVVEGQKCVEEALRSGWEIQGLYVTDAFGAPDDWNAETVSQKDMGRMSAFKNAPGALAVMGMPDPEEMPGEAWVNQRGSAFGLALDGLSDPGNLGTLLRTADWLGIRGIWASSRVVDAFNAKVVQASMGAVFRVKLWRCDLPVQLSNLQQAGAEVHALDMAGEDVWTMDGVPGSPRPWVAVLGSESHGLSPEVLAACSGRIHIPGQGGSESLNATVAASMVLGEWAARAHRQPG